MGEVISYTKEGIDAFLKTATIVGSDLVLTKGDGTTVTLAIPVSAGGATTADIDAAIAALIDSAPGTLDTLNELAAALGDDANFASTVTTALAGKIASTEKGAASGVATLDSGTKVPVAQLATGTPDGTKFLRDDRTWQAVSTYLNMLLNAQTVDYTLQKTDAGKVVEINAATGKTVTVPSTPGLTQIATDPFTGSDGSALAGAWAHFGTGTVNIQSNSAAFNGLSGGGTSWLERTDLTSGFRSGAQVECDFGTYNTGIFQGVWFGQDHDNCYWAAMTPVNGEVRLYKRVAGVDTLLQSVNTGASMIGYTGFQLRASGTGGSTIDVMHNGSSIISVSNTDVPDGTKSGLVVSGTYASNPATRLDNYKISSVTAIFVPGDVVRVRQVGVGTVTLSPAAGVTLHGNTVINSQWNELWLQMRTTNDWDVLGPFANLDSSGKVPTSQLPTSPLSEPINVQTADYTLVAGDAGKVVEINDTAAHTVTIPAGVLPVGTVVKVRRTNTGPVSIAAAGGVTINPGTPTPSIVTKEFESLSLPSGWYSQSDGTASGGAYARSDSSTTNSLDYAFTTTAPATVLKIYGWARPATIYIDGVAVGTTTFGTSAVNVLLFTSAPLGPGSHTLSIVKGTPTEYNGWDKVDLLAYDTPLITLLNQWREFELHQRATDSWEIVWPESKFEKGVANGYAGLDANKYVPEVNTNPAITANNQTGTTYHPVLSDAGRVIELNNASAITLTIDPDATTNFPIGTVIELWQQGAGQVTVAPGAGVTIRSPGGLTKIYGQYSGATLRKRAANEWVLQGDLA